MNRVLREDRRAIESWIKAHSSDSELIPADFAGVLDRLQAVTCEHAPHPLTLVRWALDALTRIRPESEVVEATLFLPLVLDHPDEVALGDHFSSSRVEELLAQLGTLNFFGRNYLPDDQARAEGLRQLLMALVADARVVLIALAWQIARLKAAQSADDAARREVARETR